MATEDFFPRGTKLPKQSPLFWVQQKDRYLRQLLIQDIECETERRLIVYFANRYADACEINIGDISYITELVGDLDGKPTDLLLNTGGGQTDATEAIVSLLQSTIDDLRVIVPHSAKSNGTMICLAASKIVMGAPSELGPIDPYLNGTPTSILAEPTVAAQNFALHKLAMYAIEQTKKLAKSLLSGGMMSGRPEAEIDETIRKLASRDEFFSHGSVIDHVEAENLGLEVEYLPQDDVLWQKLWLLYSMYAHDAGQSGVVKIFEGRSISTAVLPPTNGTP
ncbi:MULTISPECIES: SDH family Clp fold serine proteinase [unclassified Phaeobacter]|uniref:SDH family Clp fold serine proteinase n=1 Tax=unclassified Phaeobacter TaxID=2621772 RepID=UPI003A8BF6D8